MRRFASIFAVFIGTLASNRLHAQTATQTFDSEASASADGWTGFGNRVNNFDFGFSATSNADGASGPGEAGGRIARSLPSGYFADVTLSGEGDLSRDLRATGRLKFQDIDFDGEVFFGWFDRELAEMDIADNLDFLGFSFREPNNGLWRVFASIDDEFATADHGPLGNQLDLENDTAYDFEIDWDADGGAAAGDGKLTVTLTSAIGQSTFVSEVEGFDELTFDAFGMMTNNQTGAPGQIANFWFDDLEYSLVAEAVAPGDFNSDGTVDATDFAILSDNLAAHLDGPVALGDGDINLDGRIDLTDFGVFKSLFPGAVAQAQGVPEPAAFSLLACGLAVLMLARRSRQTTR